MTLLARLHGTIRDYLDGALSLQELERWLGQHVAVVEDAGDRAAADLSAEARILVSEYGRGDRDEPSLREELEALLPVRNVRVSFDAALEINLVAGQSLDHPQVVTPFSSPTWFFNPQAAVSNEVVRTVPAGRPEAASAAAP